MLSTTFHERSAWVSLLATSTVAAWFFRQSIPILNTPEVANRESLVAFTFVGAVAVALMVVLQIAGHIVAALAGGLENEDERDRAISVRADQVSGIVLSIGVFSTIAHILASGWFDQASVVAIGSPFGILNLLIGAMVVSEVSRCLTQIFLYRRSS